MKRILYILLVALAWGMTAQAQPKAEFDKKTHQFGTILWKNPATATFKITFTGDAPLVISTITTSCA